MGFIRIYEFSQTIERLAFVRFISDTIQYFWTVICFMDFLINLTTRFICFCFYVLHFAIPHGKLNASYEFHLFFQWNGCQQYIWRFQIKIEIVYKRHLNSKEKEIQKLINEIQSLAYGAHSKSIERTKPKSKKFEKKKYLKIRNENDIKNELFESFVCCVWSMIHVLNKFSRHNRNQRWEFEDTYPKKKTTENERIGITSLIVESNQRTNTSLFSLISHRKTEKKMIDYKIFTWNRI